MLIEHLSIAAFEGDTLLALKALLGVIDELSPILNSFNDEELRVTYLRLVALHAQIVEIGEKAITGYIDINSGKRWGSCI